jgi:Lon-like ATP-dependent protease
MESDVKDKLIEKFRERAVKLKMPESARKVFDEELNKHVGLEPASGSPKFIFSFGATFSFHF